MDPHRTTSLGATPPYEPYPTFVQPQMQHHDSYNNAPIQPYPQQHQHQQPMSSPPMNEQKHEYYTPQAVAPQHQNSNLVQHQFGVQNSQYQIAIPLVNLGEDAAPVDCPCCHMRALTKTEYHSGTITHSWAAILCLCFCLGCLPYMIRKLKDVEHKCGHCGTLLATWHNSGRVVVHQQS